MGTAISQDEKTRSLKINAFNLLVMHGYQNYGIKVELGAILGGYFFKMFSSMVMDHQNRLQFFIKLLKAFPRAY